MKILNKEKELDDCGLTIEYPTDKSIKIHYSKDLGDKVEYGYIDSDNPENNSKIVVTKEEIAKRRQELKDKVKIGNYYSYDGIEYAERIKNDKMVKEVLEDLESGLCSEVWTLQEFNQLNN